MTFRTYITKSRAGHYTATIRTTEGGHLARIHDKLPNLQAARDAARDMIAALSAPTPAAIVAGVLAEVPAVEGVTLTVRGGRFAMEGPTGLHTLAIDVCDRARLLAHWQGFLANTAREAAEAEAREAAMHREYQEGWDAFHAHDGAVNPHANPCSAAGNAWEQGWMAAARNARENRAMGL